MRRLVALALFASTAMAAPAVAQDCATRLDNLRATIDSPEGAQLLWTSGMQEEVRALWRTASSLLEKGDEEACQQVTLVATSLVSEISLTDDEGALPGWGVEEVTSLEEAVPVDEYDGRLGTDEILASNLRNTEDQFLGEIEDVVLGDGGIRYVLVDTDSFLGIGDRQVAVPWRVLRVTEGEPVFVLDISPERLREAPAIDEGTWETVEDDIGWMQENDAWFADAMAD